MVGLALAAALLFGQIPVSSSPETPTVYLKGAVDEGTLDAVLNDLRPAREATLVITSVGGNVLAGLDFIQEVEKLRAAKGLIVHCVGDLYVASMAAVILESGACTDRAITDRTMVLFHQVQAPPGEIKNALDYVLAVMVAPRLGMTVDAYLQRVAQGDWVMTSPVAMQHHVADRVIVPQNG